MGINKQQDEAMMRLAITQARLAEAQGEVPIGAVITYRQQVIGQGYNQVISLNDPTAHAEVMAIKAAGQHLCNYRMPDTSLYVTLEPCLMCSGALVHARVSRLVFAAFDRKTGVVSSIDDVLAKPYHNHKVEWQGGVLAEECGRLLSDFFKKRRDQIKSEKAN